MVAGVRAQSGVIVASRDSCAPPPAIPSYHFKASLTEREVGGAGARDRRPQLLHARFPLAHILLVLAGRGHGVLNFSAFAAAASAARRFLLNLAKLRSVARALASAAKQCMRGFRLPTSFWSLQPVVTE